MTQSTVSKVKANRSKNDCEAVDVNRCCVACGNLRLRNGVFPPESQEQVTNALTAIMLHAHAIRMRVHGHPVTTEEIPISSRRIIHNARKVWGIFHSFAPLDDFDPRS